VTAPESHPGPVVTALIRFDASRRMIAVSGPAVPGACAVCDQPEVGHGEVYSTDHTADVGRVYVAPSDGLRLARMRARRAGVGS
jgi:hypothetical protein